VLLGDVLELRHGPLRDALAVAAEPLGVLGRALGAEGEAVILAGNHDHALIDGWSARRGLGPLRRLEAQQAVDWAADEPLGELARMLSPARVAAAYPGLWLRDDVYATHGHYLDLHLTVPTLERLATGVMRRVAALDGAGPQGAQDYELVLAPLYAWVHALAQHVDPARGALMHGGSVRGWRALAGDGRRGLRARASAWALPLAVAGLNALGLGPLRPQLSGGELRRAGLRAMGEVVTRLGVGGGWVIFGHTHRAGPLDLDDGGEWLAGASGPGAVTRLVNCGCWVSEPAFLSPDPRTSPYRPGFCVLVDEQGPPQLVNLLDGFEARAPA